MGWYLWYMLYDLQEKQIVSDIQSFISGVIFSFKSEGNYVSSHHKISFEQE